MLKMVYALAITIKGTGLVGQHLSPHYIQNIQTAHFPLKPFTWQLLSAYP